MQEIKPCPFCGGSNIKLLVENVQVLCIMLVCIVMIVRLVVLEF